MPENYHREHPEFALCGLNCVLCPMHLGGYCPGCGGTRALMALAQGRVGAALWYHTPVVITLALAAIYLFSQTAWRLRGKRGWVLRYDRRWPMVLVGLFLANCVVRNVLWLGLGVPL